MPTLFSAFGRRFAPSWPITVLAVAVFAAFIGLGRWQWHRGVAKQATWAEFARDQPALRIAASELDGVERFTRVTLDGHFDPRHQFLLDNISHAGRPGYEVLTPFLLTNGQALLVNRGWIPFSGYRDRLPDISFADTSARTVSGRIEELPASGLASGRAPPGTDATWPKLTSFPTHEELEAALGLKTTRRVLLLDPALPEGFVREWSPPGLPPDRHFSYAIQWWGFALVLLVLYFGLNFRKVS
jgi:cytochrome oxidase assembly protein ShyY1